MGHTVMGHTSNGNIYSNGDILGSQTAMSNEGYSNGGHTVMGHTVMGHTSDGDIYSNGDILGFTDSNE